MQRAGKIRHGLIGIAGFVGACAGPMNGPVDPMEVARDLAAACARSVCRTEVRQLNLNAENGRFELMTDLFPYADNGTVSIFPGEAIVVEFADNRSLNNPRFLRVVDQIDIAGTPDRMTGAGDRPTMSFEFKQDPGKPKMTLQIKSTLDVFVKFDAFMWLPTPDGIRIGPTSSCPVIANGGNFETWPHPIAMLVLSNFRVQPLNSFACR
jgi:hypothetical protein